MTFDWLDEMPKEMKVSPSNILDDSWDNYRAEILKQSEFFSFFSSFFGMKPAARHKTNESMPEPDKRKNSRILVFQGRIVRSHFLPAERTF